MRGSLPKKVTISTAMGTTAEKKEENRVKICEQVNRDIKLGDTSKVVHNISEFQFYRRLTKGKRIKQTL